MTAFPTPGVTGPNWGDQLIDAITERLDVFRVADYGAAEDGVADDTAELQAALLAAYNAGGGEVTFKGVLRITGPVTVWENVSLRGDSTSLLGLDRSTILLDGATAKLKLGNGTRGGHSGNFNVDCNGSGDPTGAVQLTATQHVVSGITISGAAGIGLWVYGSQNCFVHSVDVDSSGTDNVVIDGGSGGMLFTRCEWTSATGYGLRITDSDPGGHPSFGYQYGPAHNEFHHCIIEDYQATTAAGLVLVEAGTRQVFRSCGFSNSSDTTFSSGYQVSITNDCFPATVTTIVEFNGCNFHGGNVKKYPAFYVQGTNTLFKNTLVVTGQTHFQFSTAVYRTDGNTVGHIASQASYSNVTALFSAIGAGTWFFWRQDRDTGDYYKLPDASGAWAGAYPLMIAKDTDAGARLIVLNDGTIAWASGANFTALATLIYNGTTGALTSSKGMSYAGRGMRGTTDVLPTAGSAVVTDASTGGPVYTYTLTGTGSIASWTISNPVANQEITIMCYRVGAQAMVWPSTGVRYAGNAAPAAPTAGRMTWVTLRYLGGTSIWHEISRAVDVPAA